MLAHRLAIRSRYAVHHSRLLQIGLMVALWAGGQAVVRTLGLPVPGAIVGMLAALVLLSLRGLSVFSLKRGAEWLLADMLLFFVPAVLAVLDHHELFGLLGLKILLVIVASTAAVMGVTALTVDLCYRWRIGHERVAALD